MAALLFQPDDHLRAFVAVFERVIQKDINDLFQMCGAAGYKRVSQEVALQCASMFKIQWLKQTDGMLDQSTKVYLFHRKLEGAAIRP